MPKQSISDLLPCFVDYLRANPAWGSLHIVLEDGNHSNADVEFCISFAEQQGDEEGADLARLLLKMSKTQRGKLSRLAYEAIRAAMSRETQ